MTAATTTPKESRTSFASVNPNNLGTVRKLNSVLFPIKYSERFYQDVQKPDVEDFCKLGRPALFLTCPGRRNADHISQSTIMIFQVCYQVTYGYNTRFIDGLLLPIPLHHTLVGTICCRLEEKDGKEQLYLMTMGILAVRSFSKATRECY